ADQYGVSFSDAKIDHAAVVKRKNKVVKTLVSGVTYKMKSAHVTVVNASAQITGKTSDGFTVKAGDETYGGKKLLICTGSSPVLPPINGL
ncbi:MAG TPA: dihydrolipoyl dehydrogenase, partial [Clostridiales bacterium]|nr:dihydrolipoyl dehydrogenase [Clostridiales bacterium]